MKPKGVVTQGKNMKEVKKKYFFYTDVNEMYSKHNLSSILIQINRCKKNSNEYRAETRKIICWYMEIRRVLMMVIKTLPKVWRFNIHHKGGDCRVEDVVMYRSLSSSQSLYCFLYRRYHYFDINMYFVMHICYFPLRVEVLIFFCICRGNYI